MIEFLAKKLLVVEEHNDKVIEAVRKATCNTCEHYDKENKQCKICWCFIEIKSKTLTNRNPKKLRIEKTHCPLGKWSDKDTANHYRKIDGKVLL